jgi:hypothetical protein
MERTGIDELISYWNTSVVASLPPSQFYERLEEEILSEGIPGIEMTRVFWREGGWLSGRREYLRVRRGDLVFDICGFPIGNSFTVSWWLGTIEKNVRNLILEIPLVGAFLEKGLSPATYYSIDAETSFQRAIHNSVVRMVDDLTDQNELKRLGDIDRVPVMAEFYE